MKNFRPFAAAAFVALSLASVACVSASEPAVTRNVKVSNFSGIDASVGVEVVYVPSSTVSATVQAPAGKIDLVKVVQRGEMLNISLTDGKALRKTKVKVTVSSPLVNTFMASSGAEIKCRSTIDSGNRDVTVSATSGSEIELIGVNCKNFSAQVNSGAEVEVNRLTGSSANVEASSGGEVDLGGNVGSVSFSATSGASVDAGSLVAESGTCAANSGASVKCNITGKSSFTTAVGGTVKNVADR